MARETLPGDPDAPGSRLRSVVPGALLVYLVLAVLLTAEAWSSPTKRGFMAMRLLVGCACTDRSVRCPCVRAGAGRPDATVGRRLSRGDRPERIRRCSGATTD